MDFLTAGIAIIAVQLCMALALAGIYLVDPARAAGAQYWAFAELLIAAGIASILIDAGNREWWILIFANNAIVWGAVFQLWGLRSFAGVPAGRGGWIVAITFFVLHTLLLGFDGPLAARVVLFTATMMITVSMCFVTAWKATAEMRTLGAALVLSALALLFLNNTGRLVFVALDFGDLQPVSPSIPAVFVMYLVPLASIVLYSVGLLLLYFERTIREQQHLATHDELTGLLNRRALVAAGEREVGLALRSRRPLSVALVDIDFFKRINDQLGHQAGDAVLIDIARMLSQICRHGDLIGRYGGEEFCIVFPGVDSHECGALGQRLLDSIRQYRFRGQIPVTVSAGFATLDADGIPDSWAALVRRADVELYKAKGHGRDGFFISDDLQQRRAGASERSRSTLPPPIPHSSAA